MSHSAAVLHSAHNQRVLFQKQLFSANNVNSPAKFGGPLAFFGPAFIEGTTTVAANPNLPKSAPVRLYDRASGLLVRQVQSTAAGIYRFQGLRLGVEYTIIALDESGEYNAVVADKQRAKL